MTETQPLLINEDKDEFPPLQRDILNYLEKNKESSRRDIVANINAPRTTIYDNLLKLLKKNLLIRYQKKTGQIGRPRVYWRLIDAKEVP